MSATILSRPGARARASAPRARALALAALAALVAGVGALACSAPALAAAGPAWELVAVHGPTNVPLKPAVDQVVTLRFHADVGKFVLKFANEETGEEGQTALLAFDAKASAVQRALERLKEGEPRTAIGSGNVTVSGGYDAATESATYTVQFTGELAGRYLGEESSSEQYPLEMESEVTEKEEERFEKEEERKGGSRTPEAPEGEFSLTTPGYHDTIEYRISPANRGAQASSGPIELREELPGAVLTKNLPGGEGWSCTNALGEASERELERERAKRKLPEGAGLAKIACTYGAPVDADAAAPPVEIEAYVEPEELQGAASLKSIAAIEGGGAEALTVPEVARVSEDPAAFGLQLFTAGSTGAEGRPYTQAGGHPYAATTGLFFNTVPRVIPATGETEVAVSGRVKDVDVKLPAGFLGNPLATERCPQAQFTEGVPGGPVENGSCPPDSQVGVADVYLNDFLKGPEPVAVYNLVPPPGVPAEFGFIFANVPVRLDARVVHEPANGGEYRVTVLSADVNEAYNVYAVQLTLWGVPGESSHTPERFKKLHERGAAYEGEERPFLINPTDCLTQAEALEAGSPDANLAPVTTAVLDSWERQGALDAQGDPQSPGENWAEAQAASPPVTGCESLSFEPTIAFAPHAQAGEGASAASTEAESPSGYQFQLAIPQKEELGELATPELRDAEVTLPEGLVLSPAAANGLLACSPQQIDLESTALGHCPQASQVGSVSIKSQLLEEPLPGRLYVGEPECHPCSGAQVEEGKLLKLYIEAEEAGAPEAGGVRVKLAGSASVDQRTGQLTTTFENNPQLPFETLTLQLRGGPRAPLANPATCSEGLRAGAELTPWSLGGETPGGQRIAGTEAPAAAAGGAFAITGCPASLPFDPTFNAGTESSAAGAYSSFTVSFSRQDHEQTLSGVSVQTPPGLLGKIAGIPRCEGLAAESATVECPAASRIGTATSAAGAGSEPLVVSGPVYLTGGYHEAPFGLKIAVPAKAGPFELGNVVVRAAIEINKTTSAITVKSDPLPQGIDGIPFRLKSVKVQINRPEFMFNPTNCEPQEVKATLTGAPASAGEAAVGVQREAPFTATGCSALGFRPSFTASTEGRTSKLDGAGLLVKVAQHPGEADIRRVEVQLPEALPSRQTTLREACPEKQFAENPAGCDEGSLVGTATARTPLLAAPLTGPAYLVSHGGLAFPDLVFLLQGEGVLIELVGDTDIKKINGQEITFSKFEAVPDAPISSFETDLPEGPHSVLDFYGDFCAKGELFAPTTIVAQNDARFEQDTRIAVTGCPPTVSIARAQVKANRLLLTVKLSQAGLVRVSGRDVGALERTLQAGTHTLALSLDRAGRQDARRHRELGVSVTLTVGTQKALVNGAFKG